MKVAQALRDLHKILLVAARVAVGNRVEGRPPARLRGQGLEGRADQAVPPPLGEQQPFEADAGPMHEVAVAVVLRHDARDQRREHVAHGVLPVDQPHAKGDRRGQVVDFRQVVLDQAIAKLQIARIGTVRGPRSGELWGGEWRAGVDSGEARRS